MKRYYSTPRMEMTTLHFDSLLGSASSGNIGIGHGGTDDGTHEADARRGGSWNSDDE